MYEETNCEEVNIFYEADVSFLMAMLIFDVVNFISQGNECFYLAQRCLCWQYWSLHRWSMRQANALFYVTSHL